MDLDAIIIGAGACGLMCAVQAGYLGKKVLVLEKSEKPGKKILISGGGRCNFTNIYATDEQFISKNPHFIKSAFTQWTVSDTLTFFEMYGLEGAEKTLGQLFPVDKNAKDIVDIFVNACAELEQEIQCEVDIESIELQGDRYLIKYKQFNRSIEITAPKLVVATGGLPIPKMGATDFALRFAKQHDLPIVETAPALVPLTITGKDEQWYAQLSGNSVFCRVSNERISFEENILFTHWGLSGPAILQISSYWKAGETIVLDFMPNNSIEEVLKEARQGNGKMLLSTLLNNFYTKKFTDALGNKLPINKQIASLTKEDFLLIEKTIHQFVVKPAGTKGYEKAEVMRGGISTEVVSSKTLECKTISGLFFGGECLDVTGWLGGYNFQWAWASGYVIAQNL